MAENHRDGPPTPSGRVPGGRRRAPRPPFVSRSHRDVIAPGARIMARTSISEHCTSYTPPSSGEFSHGYCVWTHNGPSLPTLVPGEDHCEDGFQCGSAMDVLRYIIQLKDVFPGECFNHRCTPAIDKAAGPSDDQEDDTYELDDQERG